MVTLIRSTAELIKQRASLKEGPGFVPTMGNLHAGHVSLLTEALKSHQVVYFSIFVNPRQFAPHEDFNHYPRTLEHDLELITEALKSFPGKEVVVFAPANPQEIYPAGFNQTVSVWGLKDLLEGAQRPGHFDGVTTVVLRLFELVQPSAAYFGLKDYQQWLIIRTMVQDLALPIKIIGMPIVRDQDGLALSSRNQYLTSEQRKEAPILHRTLQELVQMIAGKRANLELASQRIEAIRKQVGWNYLEMRDAFTLAPDITSSHHITLLGVYQLGNTRLLDNLQVTLK